MSTQGQDDDVTEVLPVEIPAAASEVEAIPAAVPEVEALPSKTREAIPIPFQVPILDSEISPAEELFKKLQ